MPNLFFVPFLIRCCSSKNQTVTKTRYLRHQLDLIEIEGWLGVATLVLPEDVIDRSGIAKAGEWHIKLHPLISVGRDKIGVGGFVYVDAQQERGIGTTTCAETQR